jgi:hypothetical protein
MSERIAVSDAVIPLKGPVISSEGEQITAIPVRKGQLVTVATASYHRYVIVSPVSFCHVDHRRLGSRWGNDSDEFKPSRWIDGTIQDEDSIGPYANLCVGLTRLREISFLTYITVEYSLAAPVPVSGKSVF